MSSPGTVVFTDDRTLSPLTAAATTYSQVYHVANYREASLSLKCGVISGSGATLTPKLQWSPGAATGIWHDLGSAGAAVDAADELSTVVVTSGIGEDLRIAYTVAGTTPSIAFEAYLVLKT